MTAFTIPEGVASILSYVALVLTLVSSALFAFSLNHFVASVVWAVDALGFSIETVAQDGDRVVFEGVDKHLKRDQRRAAIMTRWGVAALWRA